MGIIVENTRPIRILAISGSLRRASSNSALVAAATYVAPRVVHVSVFHDLAGLPPFNPDIESAGTPDGIGSTSAQSSGRATPS